MGIIFAFSAQSGSPSEKTSGGVTERVLEIVYPGFLKKTETEKDALIEKYQGIIREAAHFAEFVPLGLFGYFSSAIVTEKKNKRFVFSEAFCILYACSDELHQYFVPGRSSQIIDIVIDSSGAASGCLLALFVGMLFTRVATRKTPHS